MDGYLRLRRQRQRRLRRQRQRHWTCGGRNSWRLHRGTVTLFSSKSKSSVASETVVWPVELLVRGLSSYGRMSWPVRYSACQGMACLPGLSNCWRNRGCDGVDASASTSTSAGPGLRRVGVCGGCMDVEIWWTVSLVDWFAGAVWCGYLWMPVAGLVEIKVAG